MITKQQKKLAKNLAAGTFEPVVSRHAAIERRSWEPWSDKENQLFFDALSRNSRNWAEIAKEVGTKRQEQVRTYYYRVLRKVSKMLSTVHYNLDNRDRVATLVAMLAYWATRQETTLDETTVEFAQACKDRLMTQKQGATEVARPRPRMPAPEKVIIQLVPASEEIASQLAEAGFNPRLQLTFKSKRSVSNIVEHITKKWVNSVGESVAPNPIRLSPLGRSQESGVGWGIDDAEVTILSVYQSLGAPPAIKLEYSWTDAIFSAPSNKFMNMNAVESVSTSPSDSVPNHSPIFESDPQNQFLHPLSYAYEPATAHASIFEMDPVEQQMSAMNIIADPFDDTASASADFGDMHFEPMTNDDDDDVMGYPDDSSATEAMMAAPAAPIAPVTQSQPRVIFKANPTKSSQEINQRNSMLTSSTLVPVVRAVTPSPFPTALNMSYGANGIVNPDTFTTYDMDNDPQYGLSFTASTRMYPNSMLDPVASSPTEDALLFGSPGLSQSPMRPKALKQHERPAMEGSDADDEDYASAYKHYHTSKRARTSDIDFM